MYGRQLPDVCHVISANTVEMRKKSTNNRLYSLSLTSQMSFKRRLINHFGIE